MVQKFEFQKLDLEGAYLIKTFCDSDNRGDFIKDYNTEIFNENGITHELKETFYAYSQKGVIRGIHFQLYKQQAKLVRCINGKIYDVIVDLRPQSSTFGQWRGFFLTGDNMLELLIPKYFGHGYLTLEDSIVSYKCSEVFYKDGDSGIIWNDNDIAVNWPLEMLEEKNHLIISNKDKKLMSFVDYKKLQNYK